MGIWQRLFGKKQPQTKVQRRAAKPGAPRVIDMRSEKEKQIERDAYADKSLGPEADRLVEELIQIGETDGYLSMKAGGKFDGTKKHIRARQIGQKLNELGGMDLMRAANYTVRARLGGVQARELEAAWGYIGNWLP